MKKIISSLLCLSLLVGVAGIHTKATAEAETPAPSANQSIMATVETSAVESSSVESASVESPAPTSQPTAAPNQAPIVVPNLTMKDAEAFDISENKSDNTCTITAYKGNVAATTIYVPAKIKGYRVASVSANVFSSCYGLKNLVILGAKTTVTAGTFYPGIKPEIWGKSAGDAANFASANGLAFHAIDAPEKITGKKAAGLNKVTLSWNGVEGAVSYNIYRKRGKQAYALYENVTTTSYANGKLKIGAKYTYKIEAVFTASNGETITGIPSGDKAFSLTPAKPKGVKAKGVRGGVQVRWKRNKKVTGYQVFMKVHVKGFKTKFNRVKTIKKNKITGYRCKMLVRGMKYSYRVRTYKVVKGKKIVSPFVTVTTKAK